MLYFLASIIVGPGLLFYALSRNRVGTDCSDSSWLNVPQMAKDSYYSEAELIMSIGSLVMIAIGFILIYKLLKQKHTVNEISLLFLVGTVMLGYTVILLTAGTWNC